MGEDVLAVEFKYTLFFNKQCKTEIGKKIRQANTELHPEAELLIFQNYSHSSSMLSKNNTAYSKNDQKNKYICIHEIMRLINKNYDESEK